MQARIIKWQQLSKDRKACVEDFESMQNEIRNREAVSAKNERINHFIKQIPLRFRGKNFDDYLVENEEQARVKKLAERFINTACERISAGTCIRFMGKPGTGKTLLSLIIYQELVKQDFKVRYEPSLEFVKELLEIKFKSQANFNRHIESLSEVPFLIIDEITESVSKDGAPTELEKQILFLIVNKRYEKKMCTLVITNRDNETLIKRLGQPTVDRLSENGITLAFEWDSYRQK